MKRWRLIVMPLIVVAVALLVTTFNRPPEVPAPVLVKNGPDSGVAKVEAPKGEDLDKILATDPMRFLPLSLDKYDKTIKGYSLLFDKHERVAGKLRKPEKCRVYFRENPFSVHMTWLDGTEDQASKVLYVAGENNGKLLGRSSNFLLKLAGPQPRDVDGPEAKSSGRFTIAQFGFKKSTERSLASMERAKAASKLHLKYDGIVAVEKLNGQKCHKFVRSPYDPLEEDGLNELSLYYDTDNWLQVGAVLKDVKGELLGEYFFSDVQINPEFDSKQFTREAL